MLLIALLLAGLTVTIISLSLLPSTLTASDRLAIRKGRLQAGNARQEELSRSLGERLFMPWLTGLGNRLVQATPAAQLHLMEARLMKAGLYGRQALMAFMIAKVALAIAGAMTGVWTGLLGGVPAAALGYILPDLMLRRRTQSRQEQITLAMPDAMDLMAVSVEAGLTLDGAFHRLVSHESRTTRSLCQEIRYFLKDVQLGRSRKEAFKELGSRAGVHDLQLLTTALYQAEAWGVEMAKVMRVQADHLRVRRLQRAEERAMKAPIKILFPLAFCIFPAIFVVLLGPAALRLMKLFPF